MNNPSPVSRFLPGFIPLLSLFVCLLSLICIGPAITPGFAAQVTLAWDANTDPAVAGYKLYYGKTSRTYGTPVDVGKVTQFTLSGIEEGKNCYFAVTAYDTNHNESAFSTELECFTLMPAQSVNGAISPSSAVVVSRGMGQTFTITPAANYKVSDVSVDGVSMGAVTTCTFSNVTANHTISASFTSSTAITSPTTYSITSSADAYGPSRPRVLFRLILAPARAIPSRLLPITRYPLSWLTGYPWERLPVIHFPVWLPITPSLPALHLSAAHTLSVHPPARGAAFLLLEMFRFKMVSIRCLQLSRTGNTVSPNVFVDGIFRWGCDLLYIFRCSGQSQYFSDL